jgi:hypothetical protein
VLPSECEKLVEAKMADDDVRLHSDVAAFGLLTAMNLLVDVLITHIPDLEPEFEWRVKAKIDEWNESDEMKKFVPALSQVLRVLARSDRAMQRRPPQGSA